MSYLSDDMRTAIAVQAYNRPDHLKVTLDSLVKNRTRNDVWVWVDAPANNADQATQDLVMSCYNVASSYKGFRTSACMTNLGANVALLMQVDYLFSVAKYDAVIQLCDDLILSPNYIRNVEKMLKVFNGDQRVGMVSAMGSRPKGEHDQYLDCYTTMSYQIGIATWKDRWARWRRHVQSFVDRCSNGDANGMKGLVERFGANVDVTGYSCDALLYALMLFEETIPVSTVANCLKNIGQEGACSTVEMYNSQGWDSMPFYEGEVNASYPAFNFFTDALIKLRQIRNKS